MQRGSPTLKSSWNSRIKSRLGRVSNTSRVSFFVAIALAGFAGAYLPATGSSSGAATTTVPNPDPYRPTTRSAPPPPPPPPAYVAPQPPPPPPPAATAAPPTPPAPVKRAPKKTPVRRTYEPDRKGAVAARRTRPSSKLPPSAGERRLPHLVAAAVPAPPAATTHELHVPAAVVGFFAVSLALLLAAAAVAVVPARALPSRLSAAIDGRRDLLLLGALGILGFAFALILLLGLASA